MVIAIDPDLTRNELDRAIHLQRPADTNFLSNGDVVESWDFAFRWDEKCRTADELEKWRSLTDDLADDWIATLAPEHMTPRHDQLRLLLDSERPEAKALLDQLTALPPQGVRATYKEQSEAAECFARFAGGLLLGTFYFSLVGGFSSPRISAVLHQTSYLVAPINKADHAKDHQAKRHADSFGIQQSELEKLAYAPITDAVKQRTSTRLLETLQMVLDILDCPTVDPTNKHSTDKAGDRQYIDALTPIHGAGWQSLVRTRLLHGIVRRRVMRTVESGKYNFEKDGYPINQEDMTATLASFCIAPLWALQQIHSPCPEHLKRAYVAHWRHCGYLLGIPSDILIQHFDVSQGLETPNKLFASLLTHLFAHPSDFEDLEKLPPPSLPLLHSMSDQPPFRTPLWRHLVVARFFLGDQLATALGIPYTTKGQVIRLKLYLWGVVVPEYFGRVWRKGWEQARGEVTQELLARVVRFSLGRRSAFRAHSLIPDGGAKQEPDLSEEAIKAEKEGFSLNSKAGMKALRKYRLLMSEMVVVSASVVAVTAFAVYKALNMVVRWT